MTCQGRSQTVCPRLLFFSSLFFCPRLFFSARLAFVVIAQHFSASRFLSIFIKVKALSAALLTPVPPSSFHLLLFSLPLCPLALSSLITSSAFDFICNALNSYHLWLLFSFPSISVNTQFPLLLHPSFLTLSTLFFSAVFLWCHVCCTVNTFGQTGNVLLWMLTFWKRSPFDNAILSL